MTVSVSRRTALVAGAFALSACASFIGVFVTQHDQIKAPHARHKEADVECATCHETIFDSTELTTNDKPKEKVCFGCHKDQKENKDCAYCHTKPDKPTTFATIDRELKMNHAEHLERVKEDCTVCHKTLPNPLRTEGMAPKMERCLECHEHQAQWDNGQCDVCHKDLSRYPLKPFGAFSHKADFVKNHRLEARSGAANCATCHEQNFCTECHVKTKKLRIDVVMPERVDRAFIHRNDFLSRHAIEASADQALCQRCHGVTFCQECHAKNGLTPGAADGLNPHAAGFGEGPKHGAAARRDIVSCAACHDQGAASICVSCHKVGGAGGSPHPPSWLLRHPKEEIGKNAMCQICHL